MIKRRGLTPRSTHAFAFTLVELLVVIGIIALLISILLPALGKAQRSARISACLSNQRQLVTALLMYCQDNKSYFPGGPGQAKENGVLKNYVSLASWDPVTLNPYSCNQDAENGPTFFAKYVSNSRKIAGCPAASEPITDVGMGTPLDITKFRTNYWYPMSLVYKPEQIFSPNANIPRFDTTPQTPQKITAVRHPTQKAVIIDYQTYHDKVVFQTNKVPDGDVERLNKRIVLVGFADGHVAQRNVNEMFDRDINYTGRNQQRPEDSPDNAGVRGRDFP